MENKQRKLNIYLTIFSALTAISVTIRSVASFLHLNSYGYYSGSLASVSDYLMIATVLLLFSYAVVYRAEEKKRASFGGALTYAPGAPLALCMVLLGITFFQKKAAANAGRLLFPMLALLAFAGALYFLFAALYEHKICDLRACFCMACTLFFILYAGYLYFDTNLPLNAQTKLCDQMAYVAASVFFLFETRISLGREKWPLYTACGLVASAACAYSAIPSFLVYCFQGNIISNSIEETLVTLSLFAYILCRTVLSLLLNNETPTPLMSALHADADRRACEITSHGPLPFEPQSKPDQSAPAAETAEADAPTESVTVEIDVTDEEKTAQEGEEALAHAQEDNNEENSGN